MIRPDPSALVEAWDFKPSAPSFSTRIARARLRVAGRLAGPDSIVLRPPTQADRWNCLFLFMPDGALSDDQRLMVERLRTKRGKLLIVFAAPGRGGDLPPSIDLADAIIWKQLHGYDFSAYAIALDAVAKHSPGATAYLQNDSVLGPFGDLDRLVDESAWELTGFSASAAVENHISSYAFVIRRVTPERVADLAPILSTGWSYNSFSQVVMLQETRLARIASRTMSVGALWYMPIRPAESSPFERLTAKRRRTSANDEPLDIRADATLAMALDLLDKGYPFVKRSHFTKFSGVEDNAKLRARLDELGWVSDR